jgi:putative sterol carrier protein
MDIPEEGTVGEILTGIAAMLDGKRPDVTTTLKFEIDGEGIYRLVIDAGKCRLEQGDGEAEATLSVREQDAQDLLTGQLNPMLAMATRKLKVKGNIQRLMILRELV